MTIEDIALQMTPGIGVKGAVHLLGVFSSARNIFAAAPEELAMKAALREDIIRNIVHRKGFAAAEKELGYCRRNSISAIASTDPEFPALLREIPDYPHVLYLKGNAAALSARCVAMVGTRRATPYGQTMCNRLVEGLAAQVPGLCIVSGLAFGIDVAAHRAALAAGVRTVAVLANPLPGVMPAQHTAVARDILDHGGALVTELHSQTRQNGTAYLARNRIIAGLGAGCVVVESPDSGGSLATAHCADGYDRSGKAGPGRAPGGKSSGGNPPNPPGVGRDEPPDPQPQSATRDDRRRYCPRTDVGSRPGTGSIPGKTVHTGAYARRSWVAGLFPHGRPAGGGNPRGAERTGTG